MISTVLLKKEIKANYKILLLIFAVIAMYDIVVVMMFDPELGNVLQVMEQAMPELFAAFGMSQTGTTLLEFVSNYLYGFLLVVLPIVFILVMCSRLITRYVDKGSMANLLSTSYSRTTIITTQLVVLLLGVISIVLFNAICIYATNAAMFSESMNMSSFLLLNVGLMGLLFFLSGMCFLFAVSFDDTKYSLGLGAGLTIVFVLIQMLSQIGDTLDWLQYLTPLTLYDQNGLIASSVESSTLLGTLALYIVSILFMIIGIQIFKKRDISI